MCITAMFNLPDPFSCCDVGLACRVQASDELGGEGEESIYHFGRCICDPLKRNIFTDLWQCGLAKHCIIIVLFSGVQIIVNIQ